MATSVGESHGFIGKAIPDYSRITMLLPGGIWPIRRTKPVLQFQGRAAARLTRSDRSLYINRDEATRHEKDGLECVHKAAGLQIGSCSQCSG